MKNKEKLQNLTTMEWNIYNDIKEKSEKEEWTSVISLANKYDVCKREIRRCINHIRANDTIQKIILTDYQKGYKLMSDFEEKNYLEKRKISLAKQFKQYWKDIDRLNKNGQYKITITEYERNIYESILKMESEK